METIIFTLLLISSVITADQSNFIEKNPPVNKKSTSETIFKEKPFLAQLIPLRYIRAVPNNSNLPPVTSPLNGVCGQTTPGAPFPWVVSIQDKTGQFRCFGTLITKQHVLTSKQCLCSEESCLKPADFKVWTAQSLNGIQKIFSNTNNNLTIILLKQQIVEVNPICLWQTELDYLNNGIRDGLVMATKNNNNSNNLEFDQIEMRILHPYVCIYLNLNVFRNLASEQIFCAGQGDLDLDNTGFCNRTINGSGFMMKYQDRWYLRGVLNDFERNCDQTFYAVFTDINNESRDWILSV